MGQQFSENEKKCPKCGFGYLGCDGTTEVGYFGRRFIVKQWECDECQNTDEEIIKEIFNN